MTPDMTEQLRTHTFGGFISGVIAAITSLIVALVISPQALTTQILLFVGGGAVLIGFTAHFMLLFRRCRRIMNRLGIIDVIERAATKDKTNKECDWPTKARFRYKFFGLSAVNVLTHECILRMMDSAAPEKLEIMYLDPTCETAIRRMAKHESQEPQKIREPEELKMNIATMLRMAEKVKKHLGPPNVTLVRHPLIPTFRVAVIDNDLMYLGEYPPASCGFFSDLVVLQNLRDKPSLYATFHRYYERTRMVALMHLVARTAICEKFRNRVAASVDIRAKVVSSLQPEVENVQNFVTVQLVEDIFKEYGLDFVQREEAVQ